MATASILTVNDYVQLPAVPADGRFHYGSDPEQFADLYLPPAAPTAAAGHPVLVLIHGGCWGAQYGLGPLGTFSRTMADLGIAVWNVEYRRIGNGGGWPNTFLDVAAATDFLRTVANAQRLDLERVVVAGHSAGGHLALWLAARPQLSPASALHSVDPLLPRGVVALAGIPDLRDAERNEICRGAVPQLLGGPSAAVPERYRDGSPNSFLPLGIPQQLIIGTVDQAVPLAHNERYVAEANAAGDPVSLTVLPAIGHFEIVIPGSTVWPVVQAALVDMVQSTERKKRESHDN